MDVSSVGHLLVVDDNEMNRDVLSRRLERQGYSIALAEDGEHALSVVRTAPFDLILLDIMMPKMNGYQVLEHLKADPDLRHIPVVVISAVDELDSVVKCIELGAEDYLFKPFNPVLLKARVSACIEKKRLIDMNRASGANGDELTTPVREIRSAAESLAGSAGTLSEHQRRLVEQIMASADTLNKRFNASS
jgi:CheY-like chemotaxis protein